MRVSSNALPMPRRSFLLRGLAAALAGASVPVAAIAGITARNLMADNDAELLDRCKQWHERRPRLRRLEKEMVRLDREAAVRTPPKPQALFEPVALADGPNFLKRPDDGGAGPSGMPSVDGAWARDRLEMWVKRRPIDFPTPECRAHCQKLLALLDEHEDTAERLLAPYRRIERIWKREHAKSWRLFKQIIRTRAATLQGAAAQLEVIERQGALTDAYDGAVAENVVRVARNLRRLIAAQAERA